MSEAERDALREELQRINPVAEPERYGELFARFARLEGELRRAGEPGGPRETDSVGRREGRSPLADSPDATPG